jgi:hypothetical protein
MGELKVLFIASSGLESGDPHNTADKICSEKHDRFLERLLFFPE